MKVLYVVGSGYGNMVLTTPTIHALSVLGYKVDVAIHNPSHPGAEAIFKNKRYVNQVFDYERGMTDDYETVCGSYWRHNYGKHTIRPEKLDPNETPEALINLTVAQKLGYKLSWVPDGFFGELEWVGHDSNIVYIGNPAAQADKWQPRAYPHIYRLMAELEKLGYQPVQIGSKKDAEYWDTTFEGYIAESIGDCAATLAQGLAYIGQDCGMSHIASIMGVPSFVIFGPTSWIKNAPVGRRQVTISNTLKCMPCYDGENFKKCAGVCMLDLTPDVILEDFTEMIGG